MATDGTLQLVLQDVRGRPLREQVDIMLRHQALSDERLAKHVDAARTIVIENLHSIPQGTYRILVDPPSYLAVSQFVNIKSSVKTPLTLTFPVDPKKIKNVTFPSYSELPAQAQRCLSASDSVLAFEGKSGEALYASVDPLRRAGLLNIIAKARATVLGNNRSVLEYFTSIREVRGDRLFATVSKELRQEAEHHVAEGLFRRVDGSLHPAPSGFVPGGSFKTDDHYGNLQLTFFVCGDECLVDVDIDDAAGLAHVFQVARNELTGRPTHPYDIREILIHFQGVDPGYTFEL